MQTTLHRVGVLTGLILFLVFLPGCGHDEPRLFLAGTADRELNNVADSALATANINSLAILVDSPNQEFFWKTARGIADPTDDTAMTPELPFRAASIGKMFTAVLVLQLVEHGFFSLDTRLGDVLGDADMPPGFTLAELHQFAGAERGGDVTIRQLLNHTSGLRDYVLDASPDDPTALSLTQRILADILGEIPSGISQKQWSPAEVLGYFFDSGLAANAVAAPGATFHYSDTNYLLLGMVIEKISLVSLPNNYRNAIYASLNMDHAYLEWHEPAPARGPVHHYWELPLPGQSMNFDVMEVGINTSASWGGGGIVATAAELNRFIRGLFDLKLFSMPSTLREMRSAVQVEDTVYYGLGLERRVYTVSGKEIVVYGHSGLWGVGVYFIPATKTSIIYTMNQVELGEDWLGEILQGLDRAKLFSSVQ